MAILRVSAQETARATAVATMKMPVPQKMPAFQLRDEEADQRAHLDQKLVHATGLMCSSLQSGNGAGKALRLEGLQVIDRFRRRRWHVPAA